MYLYWAGLDFFGENEVVIPQYPIVADPAHMPARASPAPRTAAVGRGMIPDEKGKIKHWFLIFEQQQLQQQLTVTTTLCSFDS